MPFLRIFSSFLIVFCLLSLSLQAKENSSLSKIKEAQLWDQYKNAKSDSSKIRILSEVANFYVSIRDDLSKADSAGRLMIFQAEATYNDVLILDAYNYYLNILDVRQLQNYAQKIVGKSEKLAKIVDDEVKKWHTYINIANYYSSIYQYEKAIEYAYKASNEAVEIEDPILIAKSHLCLGSQLEYNKKKIDAFRSYLNALTIAQSEENKKLIMESFAKLSSFYKNNKVYEKARYYKQKEFEILKSMPVVDSLALMKTLLDFEGINFIVGNPEINDLVFDKMLHYAEEKDIMTLKNEVMSMYRGYLLKNNELEGLVEFYFEKHPEELESLKQTNTGIYYRVHAYQKEILGDLDSAIIFFNKADSLIELDRNLIMRGHFNYRFAELLERNNRNEEALLRFGKGFNYASISSYLPYMLTYANKLKELYSKQGNYEQAYQFSKISQSLSDSLQEINKRDELQALEFENEAKIVEIKLQQKEEEKQKSHSVQYTAIIVLIFTFFLILILLGQRKYPTWVVRLFGFFIFIFTFEFIILIADHKIHDMTHGTPWQILAIKVGLIAIIYPLHHYLEFKVVRFILSNKDFKPRQWFSVKDFYRKYIIKVEDH